MPDLTIHQATVKDSAIILHFIQELAKYEEAEHQVLATQTDIEQNLFGEHSSTKAVLCTLDNKPIGFAVYFYSFSTWLGKQGLFLEDLYISPEHRGLGAGKKLLKHLAEIAVAKNCGRFEWKVLDWNKPAIDFYESVGAKAQDEWLGYRLAGQALRDFASK